MNEHQIIRFHMIFIFIQSLIFLAICYNSEKYLKHIEKLSDVDYFYTSVMINLNGDLFIQCIPSNFSEGDAKYSLYKERSFYGLRKNGRPLFYDPENDTFDSMKKLYFNTPIKKTELETINIKIGDNSNYYFSPGNLSEGYSELYDFNDNVAYYISLASILDNRYIYSARFPLLNSEKGDKFILGYIGNPKDNTNSYKLILQRMKFNTPNISSSNQGSYEKTLLEEIDIKFNRIYSCLETEKKYIECLFVNNEYTYSVAVYNNSYENNAFVRLNSIIFDQSTKVDSKMDLFFKGICLKKEISVFLYFFGYEAELKFYVQIKNLVVENSSNPSYAYLENYLKSGEKITVVIDSTNYYVDPYYTLGDLVKISDTKFAFCASKKNMDYKDYMLLYIFELIKDDEIVVAKLYKLYTLNAGFLLAYNVRLVQYTDYLGIFFTAYYS